MRHLDIPGVLVLYHRHLVPTASTIMEHVNAFWRYSRFNVWNVNTELGFPRGLGECRFQTVLLHYSLFGQIPYHIDEQFLEYLNSSHASYKIAFFQDEHHYCQQRFAFLDRFGVNCVYTLIEPAYAPSVYQLHTGVSTLVYTLPGYVPDELIALGARYSRPDRKRRIDVGYRGRTLPPYMGRGAREKADIGLEFRRRAARSGLSMDIEVDERGRFYGDRWHKFLGNCRAVLGVEAGVSIFDIDDRVRTEYERIAAESPRDRVGDLTAQFLEPWEGNIPYRTASPRHFEAAALGACQILFDGNYSGIMEPMVHYIPLKKDFSNIDEVLRMFRDASLRRELSQNAYRHLISSGDYSYRTFVAGFDNQLEHAGLELKTSPETVAAVDRLLAQDRVRRQLRGRLLAARYRQFPGRSVMRRVGKAAMARVDALKPA